MGLEERTQERIIDGVLYSVTPLPFGVGRRALTRFMNVAAPVLGGAIGGTANGIEAAVASALPAIAAALTDEEVSYFAKIFGQASKYQDGANMVPLLEAAQENHFLCRYTAFFEWLAFSVEVNFAPFFGELIALLKAKAAEAKAKAAATAKPSP